MRGNSYDARMLRVAVWCLGAGLMVLALAWCAGCAARTTAHVRLRTDELCMAVERIMQTLPVIPTSDAEATQRWLMSLHHDARCL